MKSKKMIICIVIFTVISLTIGYSAFGTEMSISNIAAEVRLEENARITAFSYSSETSNGISTYEEYDKDALFTNISLPNEDSTITYQVTVTNFGNVETGVYSINNLPSNLTYSVTGDYKLKEKICDESGNCTLGATETFYITISYASGEYNSQSTTFTLSLNVDFRQFHTVIYAEEIMNNGYPSSIISGDTLTINLETNSLQRLIIYLNGIKVDSQSYTYQDNILIYENVTGNLKIKVANELYATIKNFAQPDESVNFLEAPVAGVYLKSETSLDENPVYYYRGAVDNNNILFANFCWKIVRTTSTGGVKLIYNGTPTDEVCNGTDPSIGTSAFNTNHTTTEDIRYIYADGTDSTIKTVIDNWYSANLLLYTNMLEDTPWCSDRSEVSAADVGETEEVETTYYSTYKRMVDGTPSVDCPSDYEMKVSATDIDKRLKYQTALLTSDEIMMAGTGLYGTEGYDVNAYLNLNDYWWAMSPHYFNDSGAYVARVNKYGSLNQGIVYGVRIVRPAVSLKPGTKILDGDGTSTTPYIVE